MYRIACIIIVTVVCICVPLLGHAERQTAFIRELIQHISDSSVSVESNTLQDIAVVTYLVLVNVPFVGVQESQSAIEGLIMLKNTLITHSDFLERLLALRIQEAIDCALLYEVNRRANTLNGEPVTPPYHVGSVVDDMVTSLLEQNAIVETEQAEYVLNLDGTFAQFCRRKRFDVDDVLNGKVPRAFTSALKAKFSQEIFGDYLYGDRKMDEIAIQDVLFLYTLHVIDRARDVRILWEVFRRYENFYITGTSVTDTGKIGKVLKSFPYRHRVCEGVRNKGWLVSMTGINYASPHPGDYPIEITALFFPYFKNVKVIAAQHEGIFSWYHKSGGGNLLRGKTGMWLELEEGSTSNK